MESLSEVFRQYEVAWGTPQLGSLRCPAKASKVPSWEVEHRVFPHQVSLCPYLKKAYCRPILLWQVKLEIKYSEVLR